VLMRSRVPSSIRGGAIDTEITPGGIHSFVMLALTAGSAWGASACQSARFSFSLASIIRIVSTATFLWRSAGTF
jgi:hypothetical protein